MVRSLITLKALTYAPTGGLVAAATTTSLPEHLGGVRNWDYRYCWLRDATFALYALMTGGYMEEARAWREWLLRAVAGRPDHAQILYGVSGERLLPEWDAALAPGLRGLGAGAGRQRGEHAVPARRLRRGRGRVPLRPAESASSRTTTPGASSGRMVEFVESVWQEPDEGIWEVRGPRRALHALAGHGVGRGGPRRQGRRAVRPRGPGRALAQAPRRDIHEDVCRQGYDAGLGRLRPVLRREASRREPPHDAARRLPAGHGPARLGTVEAIRRHLMTDGLVARYQTRSDVDGLPPGEGAFLACTFWLADNLALQGREAEATELFERLLALRNDVGLLSEQYDPAARRLLGNFPQAMSHMSLINTARNLARQGGPAEHRADKQAG